MCVCTSLFPHRMKRHSVYFEEANEEYLVYTGDMLAYQEAMFSFVIPSCSEFLLKHMHEVNAFLDAIYAAFYEREYAKEQEASGDRFAWMLSEYDEAKEEEIIRRDSMLAELQLSMIYNTLFRWHGDIMTRRGEQMTGAYAVSYFASWGACARTFHLLVCSQPEKLPLYAESTASEHLYCQIASKRANVLVSTVPIIQYRVGDIWNSMRIITSTLYLYNFSPPMRNYIYALFFRYGDLLASQQADEEIDTVFDNPLFVIENIDDGGGDDDDDDDDGFDAYKKLSITANKTYRIHNEFLYEGEVIFYHQLHRLQLSCDLIRYHKSNNVAIQIKYTKGIKRIDMLKLALDHWYAMCLSVAKDTYLKQTLIEKYTIMRTDMHLYHGDRERYIRKFPTAATDARDILQESRPLQMTAINNTQSLVLADLFTTFKNAYTTSFESLAHEGDTAFEERVFEQGSEEWLMPTFEQEVMLLTKLSTSLYFELQIVKDFKALDGAFILEELVTLQHIEERVFLKRAKGKKVWPVFLKLMRIYYVMDGEKVFKSLFFVEAYFVWLCLCLRSKLIKEDAIHPTLIPIIKKLNNLIQC